MIYELRIYRFHPGRKPTFLRYFKVARTFMEKYGVTFVTAWENVEREDEFIWMRSFSSLKQRQKAIDAYYGSPSGSRSWARYDPPSGGGKCVS